VRTCLFVDGGLVDEVNIIENRVVEDKISWWKMFKALLRLLDAKAALALEAELEVKRSLFVGIEIQIAKEEVRKFQSGGRSCQTA
jgi:hypothetical protein